MSRSVVPWSSSSPASSGGSHRGHRGGGVESLPLTALFPVPFVVLLLVGGWAFGMLAEVLFILAIVVIGGGAAIARTSHQSVLHSRTIPASVPDDPPVQPSRPHAARRAARRPVTVTTWVTDTPRGRLERAPLALPAGPVRTVATGEVRLSEPA